jgi:phosphatidate cytidylyltransferase
MSVVEERSNDWSPRVGNKPSGRPPRSDLTKRILVAIPAIIVTIGVVAIGGGVFALAAIALGFLCLHEYFRMYDNYGPIKLAGFLAIVGMVAAAYFGTERHVLLAAVASIPVLFLISIVMPPAHGVKRTHSMAITVLGIVWIGFACAHAVLLRDLIHGGGILFDVLIGTFLGDTAAYLGGQGFGRRRLAPHISPNKTVEGLLIGMVVSVLAVWCAGLYQDWLSHGEAILLGIAVAIFAPLGDLFESQVKRDAEVKDTGRIMGPHGGLLDRLDAVLFTVVAGYYVWLALM